MKSIIMNSTMSFIKKNCNYDETKLAEIKYGLEGLYLTITKLIVIIISALILNLEKEVLTFLLIYNIIRMPSFGLHATKSWICLLSSLTIFILVPWLAVNIHMTIFVKYILGIILILLFYKNSPADTEKRPIINKKRRLVYKLISTITAIIFVILSLIIENKFISNSFLFSLIIQASMISPLVYKVFNLPYNNYLKYLNEVI